MSKTKKILIGIILMSVLLLGLGYAAIQNVTLNITGTATADPTQSNFIVKFTGTPEVSDSSKVTAAITDDTNATINVEGLTASGETVTATYTVQNASTDLSADLTVEATNSNEEYFAIDTELAKTSIVAGEATTLTVTVELLKTPISETETSTIGIQMTAIPVQPGEEGTTNSGSETGGSISSSTLNEYGFYFGVPYSATYGNVKYSYVYFEDGSAFYYENEIKLDYAPEGKLVYGEKTISADGTTYQISDDGTQITNGSYTVTAELGITIARCGVWGHTNDDGLDHTEVEDCYAGHFNCENACTAEWQIPIDSTYTLVSAVDGDKTIYNAGETLPKCYSSQTGDIFAQGDYEYRYGQYFDARDDQWHTAKLGWCVIAIDKTKTQYGEIYSSINGKNVEGLVFTFFDCTLMTESPTIPNSVIYISEAFNGCTSLTTAPSIPESVNNMFGTFYNCTSLTGNIQINTNQITTINSELATPNNGYMCFYGTTNAIVLKGTGSNQTTLDILASTANNGNVTVEQ